MHQAQLNGDWSKVMITIYYLHRNHCLPGAAAQFVKGRGALGLVCAADEK